MFGTYNGLIGRIAERVEELANLSASALRMEHPDAQEAEIPNPHNALEVTKGMSRGKIISDILVDQFNEEFDFDLSPEPDAGSFEDYKHRIKK